MAPPRAPTGRVVETLAEKRHNLCSRRMGPHHFYAQNSALGWIWYSLQNGLLPYTSAAYTEVYRRRADGDYDLLRDVASGNTGHVRVFDAPIAIVDTLPEGTVPASLGKRSKDGWCRVYLRQRQPRRRQINALTVPSKSTLRTKTLTSARFSETRTYETRRRV